MSFLLSRTLQGDQARGYGLAFRAQAVAARWQEWGSVSVPASPGILECLSLFSELWKQPCWPQGWL